MPRPACLGAAAVTASRRARRVRHHNASRARQHRARRLRRAATGVFLVASTACSAATGTRARRHPARPPDRRCGALHRRSGSPLRFRPRWSHRSSPWRHQCSPCSHQCRPINGTLLAERHWLKGAAGWLQPVPLRPGRPSGSWIEIQGSRLALRRSSFKLSRRRASLPCSPRLKKPLSFRTSRNSPRYANLEMYRCDHTCGR
jgi:hypothetical protein